MAIAFRTIFVQNTTGDKYKYATPGARTCASLRGNITRYGLGQLELWTVTASLLTGKFEMLGVCEAGPGRAVDSCRAGSTKEVNTVVVLF